MKQGVHSYSSHVNIYKSFNFHDSHVFAFRCYEFRNFIERYNNRVVKRIKIDFA